MVKHTQNNSSAFDDELLECVWPFSGVSAWKVNLVLVFRTLKLPKKALLKTWQDKSLTGKLKRIQNNNESDISDEFPYSSSIWFVQPIEALEWIQKNF